MEITNETFQLILDKIDSLEKSMSDKIDAQEKSMGDKNVGLSFSASILGSGLFDGTGNFWTADGVLWSINTPITWKNGDTIYFYLDYTL